MAQPSFPITYNPLREFERKLDWILHSLTDLCDAPITVWIEKLWPALGRMVLEWYAFDLQNMFVAYLRPGIFAIEGRSGRHWGPGEKGKPRTRFGKAWQKLGEYVGWDPAEVLGKNLWGAEELRARPLPPGAAFLWILEGVIERALYQWMVLDLLTDFTYRWMSAVEETTYCAASRDAILLAETSPQPLLGIFGWDNIGFDITRKIRNMDFWNGFGALANGGSGSAGGSATIYLPEDGPVTANIWCRVRCTLGPSAGAEVTSHTEITRGSRLTVGCGTSIASGDLILFEIRVDAGMTLESGHLYYQQAFVYIP